jgi:large subunit ribosomal protein L31
MSISPSCYFVRETIKGYNLYRLTTKGKMAKPDIHPKWYPDAKVYCNGQVVMTVGSTKPELHVDVWSGNHPFYTGTQKIIDTEGRVERFMRKYGMFEATSGGGTDSSDETKK